jgi:hypothetical protein
MAWRGTAIAAEVGRLIVEVVMKRVLMVLCGVATMIATVQGSSGSAAAIASTGSGSAIVSSEYREITIPAGTVLPVDLQTSVGSDISRVEQPVRATLRRPVYVRGVEVLPSGTVVRGYVTRAQRPGRVKGRGVVAMRFTELDTAGEGRERISSATISRIAPATKKEDALKIAAPAAGGAVLGGVLGGKAGAGTGALIGGGAGTAYVLSTRGKDVRLGRGANLGVRLTAPVTVRVRR